MDGLQSVSDRMILLTLPWTDSEYTQLKGRIYRQGSLFGSIEIIIPQVRINLEDGDFWSWDVQRLNVIKNKKTLADAAETDKDYETPELEEELKTLIEEVGFKVVGVVERRSKFIYITGIKM